eukprot:6320208-Amphidinium_carterae.1
MTCLAAQPIPLRNTNEVAARGSAPGASRGSTSGAAKAPNSGCSIRGGGSSLARRFFLRGRHS